MDPTLEAVPCFFWRTCGRRAALEKNGKSVCCQCAQALPGRVYPLRPAGSAPLCDDERELARSLDMLEHGRLLIADDRSRPRRTASTRRTPRA